MLLSHVVNQNFRLGYDGCGFDPRSPLQAVHACRKFADELLQSPEFVALAIQYHPKGLERIIWATRLFSHSNFREDSE